jgi:hypothetical protein
MDVMYGDWKGLKTPKQEEMLIDDAEEDDTNMELADEQPEGPDPVEAPEPDPEVEANPGELQAMRKLEASFNPEASDFVTCHTGSDSQQQEGKMGKLLSNWMIGAGVHTLMPWLA